MEYEYYFRWFGEQILNRKINDINSYDSVIERFNSYRNYYRVEFIMLNKETREIIYEINGFRLITQLAAEGKLNENA